MPDQQALVPGYTFEAFCAGPASELAFLAAQACAERQGPVFNPLFLWGAAGMGKTHLLHAIGHRTHQLHPECRVLCRSVESFVDDMIYSIDERKMATFRQAYRNLDLLLLDGLEYLADKSRTQDELIHTLDELHQAQAQVVITSLWSPLAALQFSERLRDRCAAGLVIELKGPGEQELIEILARKAAYHGVHLADHVLQTIARCVVSRDVRTHEGALNRILAYATLTGREVTEEAVRHLLDLSGILPDDSLERVDVRDIQEAVSDYFSISLKDLVGQRRDQKVVPPRQVAMYLCKELTDYSYTEIGHQFGGQDGVTVIHACRKVEANLADPHHKSIVADIRDRLHNSP